jgi:hypothetical protein
MVGAAADDKAYGLDSAILDLVAKVKSDFVKPKPDPLSHSNLITIYEKDDKGANTKVATGEKRLVCFNPILKDEMDSEYSMDQKIQKSNWNQYERHYEGYYRTAISNVEDVIITYCRADKRMAPVESNKDLVGFLLILRSVCAQTNGNVKVDQEYQNLHTLHSAVGFKQQNNVDDSKFAKQVLDRYGSAIFTCGKFAFGQASYDKVLSNLPTPITFIDYLNLPANKQSPIDELVEQRIIARLIVKNSLNKKLKLHLMTTYSTNKEECYPNTVSDALALLSTFATQGKDTPADEAMVSYHESSPVNLHDDDSLSIHDNDDNEEELSDPEELTHEDDIVIIDTINEPDSNNDSRVTFMKLSWHPSLLRQPPKQMMINLLEPVLHNCKMSMTCMKMMSRTLSFVPTSSTLYQ